MQSTLQERGFFALILKQAWPILISEWAGISYAVLDTMMLGHYSAQSVQTISLATSIFITINITLMGVVHALIPIFSQTIGSGQIKRVGEFWSQGIWLAIGATILGILLLINPNYLLAMSGNLSATVKQQVNTYLHVCAAALPAILLFRVIYSLCTATQKSRLVMYLSVAGIAVKAIGNYIFIFTLDLGSTGAALATCLVAWVTLIAGVVLVQKDPFYAQFDLRFRKPVAALLKELLRLGIPMGGSYLVEVSSFTFMALLAAREGLYASGAHQIMSNLIGITYMMPMAFAIATSALAAQYLGAKKPALAHQIIVTGFIIAMAGALLTIIIVIVFKQDIANAYTSIPQTLGLVGGLIAFIPYFHFFDVLQCMSIFVLRAHRVAILPFILQGMSLLVLGLGGGYLFGYGSARGALSMVSDILTPGVPTGVSSLWLMAACSLVVSTITLLYWYMHTHRNAMARFANNKT
ncbi:MATE family efflux transporter [Brackiella oedipodis]|uniref:MATE family efflux transporter n=1 Tax=Brackiella oedipodis TaxID=124225 RepID=UPI000571810D|nr:MATE family efflux transporter [Brackiella oedipodis]